MKSTRTLTSSGNGDGTEGLAVTARAPEKRIAPQRLASAQPDSYNREMPSAAMAVSFREEELAIPTYLPAAPDKNPMFLEKRVYQGSSGKVYPLPFTDRISETRTERKWKVLWLENEFVRVMILPEIGGRIHAILDKTNGYDVIYNQRVIKPALVGLAGPWLSGGIEFNWPQHHRPATFLPVDFDLDEHPDGSKTVWCSDHDPMARMKGMHGVCLHPGKSFVELKVRAYNRTVFTQSFLWWANLAARVHEGYQSFFPPDVQWVADHARRAMSDYPLCRESYYGVNYGERGRQGIPQDEVPIQFIPPHCRKEAELRTGSGCSSSKVPRYAPNDLSFYANIPTPCSYMCMGSEEDFFGGYDFFNEAGLIHIANHHKSPGKKQWTWGNHAFGYAWDRNLTDPDEAGEYGPYIELMAGVFTDNQPDFSFLQPGETRTWSQFWYPIQKIGPAQHANLRAAVSLKCESGKVRFGISVTEILPGARIEICARHKPLARFTRDLNPGAPFIEEIELPRNVHEAGLSLRVNDQEEREVIVYKPRPRAKLKAPAPATEPLAPKDIASADELFVTGLHLEQYRHATRYPTLYWEEALRRDPLDSRCNTALGCWHLRRGEFAAAENHFRKAIERLTRRNQNPANGEAFYYLGLCLRYRAEAGVTTGTSKENGTGITKKTESAQLFSEAYAAFYKATWNQAWAGASFHALAEMDCQRGNWTSALEHLNQALRLDVDNLRARDLKAMVLRRLGCDGETEALLRETIALDPLDWWARWLCGKSTPCDLQARLDLAHDLARAGFYLEAIGWLKGASFETQPLPDQSWGAIPLLYYTIGWLQQKAGEGTAALAACQQAAAVPPDYCFPSRLEEIAILQSAMRANPDDARAPYYLGNLYYDRRRHPEAIKLWERSAKLDPGFSIVWRNLGIGYFNISKKTSKACAAYDRAFKANPADARLLHERDQLWKRLGESPAKRLRELEKFPHLVAQRDDLSVELCALYNQTGQPLKALKLISSRKFQPWEGGEGQALGQHVRTQLALGREALVNEDFAGAANHFEHALTSPDNLGEAKHLLANRSDIHYWLGVALEGLGDKQAARECWLRAGSFKGDFLQMSVRTFSEMTYYSALAWNRLGQKARATKLLRNVLAFARKLRNTPAKVDYFATSLPTMLLFDDDLQFRQGTTAWFLEAQALLGLGQRTQAKAALRTVIKRDPNHALAADLMRQIQ